MTNNTIQDANELSNKAPINSITATVKKAFEPTEGEGRYGPWRMQAAILLDETGEIRATFWDRFNTDLRNFEGETVTIVSGKDAKGKFAGVLTDDYKGTRQLRISKEAKFESPDGEEPVHEDTQYQPSDSEHPSKLHPDGQTRRFVSEETKRESIEKQVALREAVLFSHVVAAKVEDVVTNAELFYTFLHGQPEVI